MSRKKAVSIKDVASAAGVSTATVSRYLNDPKKCAASTQKKIRNALEELNYQKHLPATSISASNAIGIISAEPMDQLQAMLISSLMPHIASRKYLPIVIYSNRDAAQERKCCQHLIDQHVAGVIYISGNIDIEPMLSASNIPVVYIDHARANGQTRAICVASNHYLGAYMATEHLLKSGCKKILFLGRFHKAAVNDDRERGYLDALQTHGIEPDAKLIQDFRWQNEPDGPVTKDLVIYLVKSGLKFDGIFASNDIRAYGALSALQKCGYRVPDEIKIVGFDNLPITIYSSPPITTIRQDVELIAARTSSILFDLIENGDHYSEREFILPVSLIERGTT